MGTSNTTVRDTSPIPCQRFSTHGFRAQEQFDAWKEFSSTIIDPGLGTDPKRGFRASGEFRALGSLTLTTFEVAPMKFLYTNDVIRKSTFDHWCIGAITKGCISAEGKQNRFRSPAGSTVLHSYAMPFTGEMEDTKYTCMYFSRDEFWDVADAMDRISHQQVAGPMSLILSDFLLSLEERANQLTILEATAVNDAFGHLLRALVSSSSDVSERAKAPVAAAQFERARQFINQHLRSPDLSPDTICKALGISRRQLFYLFERYEGVSKYIRNRRLAACYDALTKNSHKRLISSVAYEFGFTNVSTFARQFQERYGFTPSEARAAWIDGTRFSTIEGNRLVDWLVSNTTK